MKNEHRRIFGRCAASLGLLALAMAGGSIWPMHAAGTDAASLVANWPESSRLMALAMIEKHGQPSRSDEQALTWFGLYRGRRTTVRRARAGAAMIEQVVLYRVPAHKVDELKSFDSRITVDREAAEMSAQTDSERTNFLLLNLAHEIASGFKTVGEAKEFFHAQMQLAKTGKSSRYRDRILFEDPLPSALPRSGYPPMPN
ncbi:MAG TPA: hypothetical protein DEB40_00505 [Elusimicrobia bacterium]|nr:hypothetical protein [Elusimicrobiota bacterium]HBT60212.1 hypothetical protein [Elusimicrobiota bacterium]